MRRSFSLLAFFLLFAIPGHGQLGGERTYEFLNLSTSARVAALGGYQPSIKDQDITLAQQNPSLLNPEMHNHVGVTAVNYVKDVQYGYATYGKHFEEHGTFAAGLQYINYGQFQRADRYGNRLGEFSAGEYNLSFAGAKQFGRFSMGMRANFILSQFENYKSFGIGMDFGTTYEDTANLFTMAFVIKNLGGQIKSYTPGNTDPLPLNIQLSGTKKFEHMPLRLTVLAHHLNIPDFTYKDPIGQGRNSLVRDEETQEPSFGEKVFRHFVINGELVFSPNFHLRFGYNHQRRQEMTIDGNKGLVGFTFGGGIKVSHFYINYARADHHLADASHHVSVITNPSEFFRKKD